jgi:hypothetical protein
VGGARKNREQGAKEWSERLRDGGTEEFVANGFGSAFLHLNMIVRLGAEMICKMRICYGDGGGYFVG